MSVGTRPVIPGFHPDPSVCVVDGEYLLACSSFEYAPGVPLFRSADLRTWEQIGHVLDRPEQLDVADAGPSGGVFAPTLRHHDGRYWMATTNWTDEGGQLISWADRPGRPVVGAGPHPRRGRHRPRPGVGRRRHLPDDLRRVRRRWAASCSRRSTR